MKLVHIVRIALLLAAPRSVTGANINDFGEQATAIKKNSLRGKHKHAEEVAPSIDLSLTSYNNTIDADCYAEGVECPAETFCQVEERDNWYPYDLSYMNRGRCLPFARLGGSCDVPFDGITSFPRKADGTFFERSTLCAPDSSCTGDHIYVMPSTCVKARDNKIGCMTTERNGRAGRPPNETPNDDSFCFFPLREELATTAPEEVSKADPSPGSTRMTQKKLEQCATILTSFNGPNFVFRTDKGSLPDDSHIESGETVPMTKHSLQHGSLMAKNVQQILKTLWPYPVCRDNDPMMSDCTSFPLPVPARDDDGGLLAGKCLQYTASGTAQVEVDCDNSSIDMTFLQATSTNGVIDYLCTWATLHTLSFNGGAVLTAAEKRAFGELIMYISGQFDCKVCRNNFVNIIKHFGLPEGNIREDYARWLWQAHNNANEHSYATHSMQNSRTPEWAHPTHEHPWYMPFEKAVGVWTNLEGLPSQY